MVGFRIPKLMWILLDFNQNYFCHFVLQNIYYYFVDEAKLTDDDISNFVTSLLPIAFHILFNNYDDERKTIFNILATLRPSKTLTFIKQKIWISGKGVSSIQIMCHIRINNIFLEYKTTHLIWKISSTISKTVGIQITDLSDIQNG